MNSSLCRKLVILGATCSECGLAVNLHGRSTPCQNGQLVVTPSILQQLVKKYYLKEVASEERNAPKVPARQTA
jgi:hypothetical protein